MATFARALALIPLAWAMFAFAQPVRVMPVAAEGTPLGSGPTAFAMVNNIVYFDLERVGGGRALWKSDGTSAGTVMVKDVEPEFLFSRYVASNGRLFFSGANFETPQKRGLWVSDGTTVGTQFLSAVEPRDLVDVNGTVFFHDGIGNLWKSNGTAAGTLLVKQHGSSGPTALVNVAGTLMYSVNGNGAGVWKSDGTSAGTVLVRAFDNAGSNWAVAHNGRYFVAASEAATGLELWMSDGTTAGTTLLKDIFPGPTGASPLAFASIGAHVYFNANDGVSGSEPWKTDGTTAGTLQVANVVSGNGSSMPRAFAGLGASVIFTANTDTATTGIWKTDGTPAGTVLVKDFGASAPQDGFALANAALCFVLRHPDGRRDLWRTDGTTAGTIELVQGVEHTFIDPRLVSTGTRVYYKKRTATSTFQLWTSDCVSPAGNTLVKDVLVALTNSPVTTNLVWMGDHVRLAATTTANGRELWRADPNGGSLVKDVDPGSAPGFPLPEEFIIGTPGDVYPIAGPVVRDGQYYWFPGKTAGEGLELWRSDGTAAGTVLVKDVRPGPAGSSPRWLTMVGSTLFFVADDGTSGQELWKSDGTAAGTLRVKDINPGPNPSQPQSLVAVNGTLFFVANDGASGYELWKSDGTEAGTVLVKDIETAQLGSWPFGLIDVGGTLFFSATTTAAGTELWKSDGTSAGTVMVKDVNPGPGGGANLNFRAVMGGVVYFAGIANGGGLWRSDGTDAGTTLVSNVPGPAALTVVGNKLYFFSGGGIFGLWVSDGTPAGTMELAKLTSSWIGTTIAGVNGVVYFAAKGVNSSIGTELWRSDGTVAGTFPVTDLFAGSGNSNPGDITAAGDRIWFTANDGVNPRSLYYYIPLPAHLEATRLSNISARLPVQTGNNVLIAGFVVGGPTAKRVAIVAAGPSLAAHGVGNPLQNPALTLVRQSDQVVLAANDDWQSATNAAQLQASGFAPSDSREAAILADLPPGAYTAIMNGAGDTTGVGVVGVYEVDQPGVPLVNISARGVVLTGQDVMIAGFVIQGQRPQTVAIVATGPSLSAHGIPNPLQNPTLTLVRSSDQAVVAYNDNWVDAPNAAQLDGAGFAPGNPLESAIFVTLPPGAYTAILSGAGGGTGISVVGVYTVN